MNCSEMTVYLLSTGQMPPSLPPGSPALSRIDCVSLCFLSVYCTSMFYNKDTKYCHLMGGFNQAQLVYTSEPFEHLVLNKVRCPVESGYQHNRALNMCYKKHAALKVWTEANTTCSAEGSCLVIVNSAERNQFMYDIAADIGPFWTSGNILLGSWRWGDNSSVSEPTFWAPSEPAANLATETCLTFWDVNSPNSWHAADCYTFTTAYVCEIALY